MITVVRRQERGPRFKISWIGFAALVSIMSACASSGSEVSLVQVDCESRRYIASDSRYFYVRKVLYWSDGSQTFEKVFANVPVENSWQLIEVASGQNPCP